MVLLCPTRVYIAVLCQSQSGSYSGSSVSSVGVRFLEFFGFCLSYPLRWVDCLLAPLAWWPCPCSLGFELDLWGPSPDSVVVAARVLPPPLLILYCSVKHSFKAKNVYIPQELDIVKLLEPNHEDSCVALGKVMGVECHYFWHG